jgi:hypothetical protein
LQDHPQKLHDAVSTDTPDHPTATPLEHAAEGLRARLIASAKALRGHAASRLDKVGERVSPDMLRRGAAAFVRRLRERGRHGFASRSSHSQEPTSEPDARHQARTNLEDPEAGGPRGKLMETAKALRLRASSNLGDLTGRAASDGALAPTWRYVANLRTRLVLSGADIATLSRGGADGERVESGEPETSQSVQDAAAIAAILAPTVIQTPALEMPVHAAETVSPDAPQSPPPERVKMDLSTQDGAMARLRNDVLVRTALEHPVLVGAAAIAVGTVLAALSSAGRQRQPRTSTQRGRAVKGPAAVEADHGDAAPAADGRPRSGVANAGRMADLAGTPDENGPPKTDGDRAPGSKARSRRSAKPKRANGGSARTTRSSKSAKSAEGATK